MPKDRLLFGGLAIVTTLSFALALIFPIILSLPFAGDLSVWQISPLISSAAIAVVAIAAFLPLWWAKKRAWLVPLICSLLIIAIDMVVFFTVAIRFLLDPNVTAKSFVSLGGNAGAGICLVPLYFLAISGTIQLAGALAVRKIRNSSSASIEMKE